MASPVQVAAGAHGESFGSGHVGVQAAVRAACAPLVSDTLVAMGRFPR